MTTTTPSALVPAAPVFTNTERLALAGRSPDHDEIRPCPRQPGPARHIHRRYLSRRRRSVDIDFSKRLRLAKPQRQGGVQATMPAARRRSRR